MNAMKTSILLLLCIGSLLYNNYVLWERLKSQAELIRTLQTDLTESLQVLRECNRQIQERTYHRENRIYLGRTDSVISFKNYSDTLTLK